MIHITKEGDAIQNGFNFYPLRDERSFGFRFRYGKNIPMTSLGKKIFWFRYSKVTHSWVIGEHK